MPTFPITVSEEQFVYLMKLKNEQAQNIAHAVRICIARCMRGEGVDATSLTNMELKMLRHREQRTKEAEKDYSQVYKMVELDGVKKERFEMFQAIFLLVGDTSILDNSKRLELLAGLNKEACVDNFATLAFVHLHVEWAKEIEQISPEAVELVGLWHRRTLDTL